MSKRVGMLPHWHENVIYPDLISTNVHAYIQMVATYRYIYIYHHPPTVMTEEHIIGVHTEDVHCNYDKWISAWTSHLGRAPATVRVPPGATVISTPLRVDNWKRMLTDHPNRPLVEFFINGLTEGFRIGFREQSTPLKSAKRNLSCALQHPDIV